MREFTGPGAVKVAADDNVVTALFERAEPRAGAPSRSPFGSATRSAR